MQSRMLQNGLNIRIRNLRTQMGLSIDEFSEIIDVSPGYLGLVERGKREFTTKRLAEISKIFNVSLAYLILGDEQVCTNDNEKQSTTMKKIEFTLKTTNFTEEECQFFYNILRAYVIHKNRNR